MNILVLADHDGGAIRDATLSAVTAASMLGGEVHVLVAGADAPAAAAQAASIEGVAKVLVAEGDAVAHQLAENLAPLVAKLMAGFDALVAPANTGAKNVLPRVAALLDVAMLSDVTAVLGSNRFERPIYAGNAIATVETSEPKLVMTVRGTSFPKAAAAGGAAPVETVGTGDDAGLSQFVGSELTHSERPELTSAKIVVSGGRALGSSDAFHQLIEPLADKLGAAVGASRAAVDAGYMPNDYQVGQTGKIVAPQVYFAIGISGAIQHLAGMKDSKTIVAINKDADAPIFQVADVGLVGDLFQLVPELTQKL
jgi:electron transfer flavoprotein alpha subunit